MAKRIDPLKAKQAKQRKIAIALGVLLVAVLAFQGPKTLKMLKGPQPVSAPTTPTPAVPTPVPTPTGAPAPAAQPAVLVDSDQPPVVSEGQLASFELFRSKDPFEQQVGGEPAEGPAVTVPAPTTPKPAAPPASGASGGSSGGSGSSGSGAVTGSPTPTAPPAPAEPPAATTSISVNGQVEDVELEASFPALEPTFVLVSIAKNGKSVQIGIAGGSYADGEDTIKLQLGKPLTLQNTADGSRYELILKTVAGFPPPK